MNVHIVRIGHLCISDAEIIMHTIHVDTYMSTVYLDYVCDTHAMHSITSSILYCVCMLLVSSLYLYALVQYACTAYLIYTYSSHGTIEARMISYMHTYILIHVHIM